MHPSTTDNNTFEYDYIVVGSGLFGAVFAREATMRGFKCLVLEKRIHLGGNVYCEKIDNTIVHRYGAHIFHTNDDKIWNYVNSFCKFNPFDHRVKVFLNDQYYSFPFNVKTFMEYWKIDEPEKAYAYFLEQLPADTNNNTVESLGLQSLGKELYTNFVENYTEKQWGKKCADLPSAILARIPVRNTVDERYFTDKYQGIPEGGYNQLIDALLAGIETKVNCDFIKDKSDWESKGKKIVYTGALDELFDYDLGKLEYRSLEFEHIRIEKEFFQPTSVVNFPEKKFPYTRIIEHKHFHPNNNPYSIITKEYPKSISETNEPYYPIITGKNKEIHSAYKSRVDAGKYIIGGRLAEFQYYEMQQVIASSLKTVKNEFDA
jgi:UDP-galactopyranose mutase